MIEFLVNPLSRFETVPMKRGGHADSTREGDTTLERREVRAPQDNATCLLLAVDDRGARYPLTMDPIAQQAYLKPAAVGTTQAGDIFGVAVAISGDTVVVGASKRTATRRG